MNPFASLVQQIPSNNKIIGNENNWAGRKSPAGRKPVLPLSTRIHILALVNSGLTDSQVSKKLNVKIWHVRNIRARGRV